MKKIFLSFTLLLLSAFSFTARAQEADYIVDSVYVVGYATSLKDSCVILTSLQAIPVPDLKKEAEVHQGRIARWKEFLASRPGLDMPIYAVFKVKTAKKGVKLLEKLRKQAKKRGQNFIIDVPIDEFDFLRFRVEEPQETLPPEDHSHRECKSCSHHKK